MPVPGPQERPLLIGARRTPDEHSAVRRAFVLVARFARRRPLGALGATLLLLLLVTAAMPDMLAPYSYDDFQVTERLQGPSTRYPFGTDEQGRDVLSRVIYGARTSVIIGLGTVALTTVVAVAIGLLSGYFAGTLDLLLQRFVDIWQAFPGLLFVIFVVSIFGHSRFTLICTISALLAAGSSRLIRGMTLSVKNLSFVEAARALGAGGGHIVLQHVLPNVSSIILINASIQLGAVMLIESTLSFLGFGVPPPFPSWGRMLNEAKLQMQYHPYLALFPGLAIAVTVYAANMLGDALRDVLDPRLRGSK
jgi:peptide/nickel transport system permease protein